MHDFSFSLFDGLLVAVEHWLQRRPTYPRVLEEGPFGPQTHFLVVSLPLSSAPWLPKLQ